MMAAARRWPALLELGLALAGRDRSAWGVRIVTTVLAGLATVVFLGIFSVPAVVEAQRTVNEAREPVIGAQVDDSMTEFSGGPIRTPYGTLHRMVVAVGAPSPVPPGLDRLPRPGEIAASPRLAELARSDQTLNSLVGGPITDIIEPDGLTDPRELFVYVGVNHSDLRTSPLLAFGSARSGWSYGMGPWLLAGAGAVFVAIPFGLCLITVLRFFARRRRTDLQRLLYLGLSPSSCAKVCAVEAMLACGAGSVLGLLGYLLSRPHLTQVPGLPGSFFADDVQIPLGVAIAICVGVPLFSVLVATVRPGAASVGRAAGTQRRAGRWYLLLPPVVAVAGFVVVAWFPGLPQGSQLGGILIAAAAIGFTLSLPPAVGTLVRMAGHRPRRVWGLSFGIAARRLNLDAGSMARTGGVFGSAVFVMAMAAPLLVVATAPPERVAAMLVANGQTILYVSELTPKARQGLVEMLRERAGAPAVIRVRVGPEGQEAAIATCRQIKHVLRISPCPRTAFDLDLLPWQDSRPPTRIAGMKVVYRHSNNAANHALSGPIIPADIAEPGLAERLGPVQKVVAEFPAISTDFEDVYAFKAPIQGAVPTASVSVVGDDAFASFRVARLMQHWVLVGCVYVGALSLLGLALSALSAWRDRRPQVAGSVAVGMPPGLLRRAFLLELCLVFGVTLVLTGGVAWVGTHAVTAIGGLQPLSLTQWALGAGATVAAAALTALCCTLGSPVRFSIAELRRE